MKKLAITLIIMFASISLAACSGDKKTGESGSEDTTMSSQKSQTTNKSSDPEGEKESIFTAVLVEDAVKNETVDQSIRLFVNEVKAVEDPDEIIGMMKNDGVILNVTKEQLSDGLTEDQLKAGDSVKFTLNGLPVMTMSIPPQIAGNAVVKVEKI